jgi:hypothetical protein
VKILNTTKDIKRWKQTKLLAGFFDLTAKKSITFTVDDLAHPRFGINDTEVKNLNKTPNPLQFWCIQGNDTLFIW